MAKEKFKLDGLKDIAQKGAAAIDKSDLKNKAKVISDVIVEKAESVKEVAVTAKEDLTEKLTELDSMLEESINEYNTTYTLMNDRGLQLYTERKRAMDIISLVEMLVNSIANKPKSFDVDISEILTKRKEFVNSCEFADRELKVARDAATGASAGLAAGASIAFMAPTAAMWVATTFGTASTGTAISALSGAAATNAAVAWLGGGAVAAGGGGVVAGNAFLAMAGPIGWTVAGATLLTSIVILTKKKTKLNKEKNDEIQAVKENIAAVKEMDEKINKLLTETETFRNKLMESVGDSMGLYNADYGSLSDDEKLLLGGLINNTKALAVTLTETIGE